MRIRDWSSDVCSADLLDMPSGHAYAKGLRTVKTCVGSEWCRFGTQDSTQMGKDLERGLFKMYAPPKVKLAVSGCPRNCAESENGRTAWRERGWTEVEISGVAGTLKQKTDTRKT